MVYEITVSGEGVKEKIDFAVTAQASFSSAIDSKDTDFLNGYEKVGVEIPSEGFALLKSGGTQEVIYYYSPRKDSPQVMVVRGAFGDPQKFPAKSTIHFLENEKVLKRWKGEKKVEYDKSQELLNALGQLI